MENLEIYLDNAATTRVCEEAAAAAYNTMLKTYGNPSSTHTKGREANKLLISSRKKIADALDCKPSEVYFTGSGTEADNWAIISGANYNRRVGKHIISSTVEHDAVRKSLEVLKAQGYEITLLSPNKDGIIFPDDLSNVLREDTALVTLMMVNNETGAQTDLAGMAKVIKAKKSKALLHTDAVQSFLKVPFSAKKLGADMISISGHKIHAPKGIGALYIREGLNLPPFIVGGSQESAKRAGTESMPLIAAFAEATEIGKKHMRESTSHMENLRSHTIDRLQTEIAEIHIISGTAPHILSISLEGYKSEVLMNFLEARGIYVSKSSACKKGGRSHVLEELKLSPRKIDGALRIGFSRYTRMADVDAFCDALVSAYKSLAHN